MTEDMQMRLLKAISEAGDEGEPATTDWLMSALNASADQVDRMLQQTLGAGLITSTLAQPDHPGSPIRRAPVGWILLPAGARALECEDLQMTEAPFSTEPSTVCPNCRSTNWILDADPPSTHACNDCGDRWHLPTRSDLVNRNYQIPCPWCGPGGLLHFDTGQISHVQSDTPISALDGTHMMQGDPPCGVLDVRWTNPPDTRQPILLTLGTSAL